MSESVEAPGQSETQPVVERRNHLNALTSLRFFAAVGVLFTHTRLYFKAYLPDSIETALDSLFCTVSLFFILSGFILTITYRKTPPADKAGVKSFFLKRFARIYPMYFISLIPMLPVALGFGLKDFSIAAFLKITLLQSWSLLGMKYGLSWNGPVWSISVEFFFYLLFPVLLYLLMKCSTKARWIWLIVSIVTSFLITFGFDMLNIFKKEELGQDMIDNLRYITTQMPYFRLPEFVMGIVLALEYDTIIAKLKTYKLAVLDVLSGVFIIAALFRPFGINAMLNHGLLNVVFGYIILRLTLCSRDSWICKRKLVLLGEASYSLYLLQAPTIYLATVMLKRLRLTETVAANPVYEAVVGTIIFFLSIGLSLLAYKLVEIPSKKWILARSKTRTIAQLT